jgi:hypothetical protein
MGDPAKLDDAGNWTGGFYELDIELGEANRERLDRALFCLWDAVGIEGCYPDRRRGVDDQVEVPFSAESLKRYGHLAGFVTLPTGVRVVCGCATTTDDDGREWLTFHIPLGALARADRRIGGFPFDPQSGRESLRWRQPLDEWLGAIANAIHRGVSIACARAGFELEAGIGAAQLLQGGFPTDRWEAVLLPGPHGDLVYTPANR